MKYGPIAERVRAALAAVLPPTADVTVVSDDGSDVRVRVGTTAARIRWLDSGWPDRVRAALADQPRAAVFAAPSMSSGSRALLEQTEHGWFDETGAANFVLADRIVVVRPGMRRERRVTSAKVWTPTTFGVAEAILTENLGTRTRPATVAGVVEATGLSAGGCSQALSRLTREGLLLARTERGPSSGRLVPDRRRLLEEYADAVGHVPVSGLRVGVVWRDPVSGAADVGNAWHRAGRDWAATGPLAAAVLAPHSTQVAPLQVFVTARTDSELLLAAREARMEPAAGGRLLLRPFPSHVTARLSTAEHATGTELEIRCAPWPRVFADLRHSGVRGEDAAEHLWAVATEREA